MLALASGALYLAGMVWNDVFDLAEDKKARAFRPLPSGRVGKGTAVVLGTLLFAAGLALASAAGALGQAEWNHEPLVFALGIVAGYALGFTPLVLLIAGIIFLIVALSYAEGTAAIPETGGAATFVRRAFNDLFGFLTGWAIFLDYLIVIALSALFLPHYLGAAMQWGSIEHNPWDVVIGVCVVFGVARGPRRNRRGGRGARSPDHL